VDVWSSFSLQLFGQASDGFFGGWICAPDTLDHARAVERRGRQGRFAADYKRGGTGRAILDVAAVASSMHIARVGRDGRIGPDQQKYSPRPSPAAR